ncbi:sulfotransferase [Halomonas sp. SH5A2]|uniref:sulfotransferase family protein n=1 Tax=Halomonas sp. SH5A2 TaxID=2749040 RepID=UPI001641EB9F|nr:sulfotransferase [Halomonas sp. SH5A2]QNI02379.1 sulfotransferase [Halomonas sp. SH5A2]
MSGRSSFMVRMARYIQKSPLWLFRFVEWPFVSLFGKQCSNTQAIFVLALPRSGSTVTYQAICHGFSVNYLSNLWHLLYQLPLVGGWLSAKKTRYHLSDFNSHHGFVPGLDGPAEGVRFWQWWLGCGLTDSDCKTLSIRKRQKRVAYIRRVFSVLARRGQPFTTAYLGHALVPDRVQEAFPGAVLIRLRREPVSNALSLLKSMRQDGSNWFSVKPHECEGLDSATEHERVAAQVYWLNRRLDDAACAKAILTIHYEQLCENPEREIEYIRQWCKEKNVSVDRKFDLPIAFPFKYADLNADADAAKIREALNKLEEKYGKLEV